MTERRAETRRDSLALFLPECLGFIFFDLFSNLGHTGCRRGRTPERPLRQPLQGLADQVRPFFYALLAHRAPNPADFVVVRQGTPRLSLQERTGLSLQERTGLPLQERTCTFAPDAMHTLQRV
jgi:hypothetical protein